MSVQRLRGYVQSTDQDDADTLARYLWNMALSAHLQAALHAFEVTLRNAIYDASLKIVDTGCEGYSEWTPGWPGHTDIWIWPPNRT